MFKSISTVIILTFFSINAQAAKVSCSFDYGDAFNLSPYKSSIILRI